MKRYVVVVPPSGVDSTMLAERFPNHYEVVSDTVWVVAGERDTCADVCELLGIGPGGGKTGVVVRMDDYYGFFDRALWEKANEWAVHARVTET